MRQILTFLIILVVLSALNRRRSRGAGPPVSPGPGRMWGPLRVPPSARPGESAPTPAPTPDVPARRLREHVERRRVEVRRRAEAARVEQAMGPHTEVPGGIDPRLLDKDRTPPPTPDPIHPR